MLAQVEESYICAEELCTHVEKVMPGIALAHSQVEESYISAEELAAAIPVKPAMILQNEISVYTALNCDLVVWSPYRALAGLLMVSGHTHTQTHTHTHTRVPAWLVRMGAKYAVFAGMVPGRGM